MKEIRLSTKSFERNIYRFSKLAKKYMNNIYSDDIDIMRHIGNEFNYGIDQIVLKLIKVYKKSPFKNKSSFTKKFNSFNNIDSILNEYKISYDFNEEGKINFKLFTKYSRRYKRKVKFVLKYK